MAGYDQIGSNQGHRGVAPVIVIVAFVLVGLCMMVAIVSGITFAVRRCCKDRARKYPTTQTQTGYEPVSSTTVSVEHSSN